MRAARSPTGTGSRRRRRAPGGERSLRAVGGTRARAPVVSARRRRAGARARAVVLSARGAAARRRAVLPGFDALAKAHRRHGVPRTLRLAGAGEARRRDRRRRSTIRAAGTAGRRRRAHRAGCRAPPARHQRPPRARCACARGGGAGSWLVPRPTAWSTPTTQAGAAVRAPPAVGALVLRDGVAALCRVSVPLLPAGPPALDAARGAGRDRAWRADARRAVPRRTIRGADHAARRGPAPGDGRRFARALAVADEKLAQQAGASARSWHPQSRASGEDTIAGMRADLHEWLRRAADAPPRFVPDRFELSFGLADRDRAFEDPASVDAPVALPVGISLRGSIDLVERDADGVLRITDHKTGKVRATPGPRDRRRRDPAAGAVRARGGAAARRRGRVDASTTAPRRRLQRRRRAARRPRATRRSRSRTPSAARSARVFFPPRRRRTPAAGATHRPICGPHEELRTSRKSRRLAPLAKLREQK